MYETDEQILSKAVRIYSDRSCSVRAAAAEVGIAPRTLYRALRKFGVPYRGRRVKPAGRCIDGCGRKSPSPDRRCHACARAMQRNGQCRHCGKAMRRLHTGYDGRKRTPQCKECRKKGKRNWRAR
jgi:hypothetical protein